MKSKSLCLAITALALLLSAQTPATACVDSLSESEQLPRATEYQILLQIPDNPNFIIVDQETGDKLLCHRNNLNSPELTCTKMPTIKDDPALSIYPAVPKTLDTVSNNDMFANVLWMLIIIGLHFVMGLFHTWFRERKKK